MDKAPTAPRRAARVVRWSILAAVLAVMTAIGIAHQRLGAGRPVGVDALCPFGGLETLGTLLTGGFLLRRVAISSVLLLGATVVTALVFRRAFCGRICPLGYLQELAGGIGRRVLGRRLTVPAALDRPARYLKYAVLAVVVGLTWLTADLIIRPYDPWAAYQHLSSSSLFTEFGVGFSVLAVSLAGSIAYDRFFCKYACPMGAFLSLVSRFSVFKVRRQVDTCIDCGLCDRACPTNVRVSTAGTVTSPECIDCGECLTACPVANTLVVAPARAGSARALQPVAAAVLPVAAFALLVSLATAAGAFAWTMPTLGGQARDAAKRAGVPVGAAPLDVSLIRGSTTLAEVAEAAAIPPEVFTRVYGVPIAQQSQQLKVLKDTYGCTPGEVRAFVTAYQADPSIAETWIPGAAHEGDEH